MEARPLSAAPLTLFPKPGLNPGDGPSPRTRTPKLQPCHPSFTPPTFTLRWTKLQTKSTACLRALTTSLSSSFRPKQPWFVCSRHRRDTAYLETNDHIGLRESADPARAHVAGSAAAFCYRNVGCRWLDSVQIARIGRNLSAPIGLNNMSASDVH